MPYAEIVASIASRSAGPGHPRQHRRVHRDHGASAIETVGGARRGKAIIVLNPAEPPLIMRDTVYCLVDAPDRRPATRSPQSVDAMVADVAGYVPGYRLKQQVQFTGDPTTSRATLVERAGDPQGDRVPRGRGRRRTTCPPTPATSTS